ncbi:MAG: hypothetical protein LWX11_02285 [Firmicutes bacterium]|nr:hypothetical protein [Bacillota bacterium]
MITGYNTDVRHGHRIFHVQTEDKGLANPRIETLIYVGGEILDSYRSSYEDLLQTGVPAESIIQSRMDEQHRMVIRDIKSGKYDSTPSHGDWTEQQIFNDRPLDQAILEYLQHEGDIDTLELVLEEPLVPLFDHPLSVLLKVRRCISHAPIPDGEITIRLVSSLRKATTLLSGKTDAQGLFQGLLQLPGSEPGQCALAITCSGDGGEDEVRIVVKDKG